MDYVGIEGPHLLLSEDIHFTEDSKPLYLFYIILAGVSKTLYSLNLLTLLY